MEVGDGRLARTGRVVTPDPGRVRVPGARRVARDGDLVVEDAAAPEILSGISAPSLWIVAEAAVWVVALHLLYRALWRRALRKYDAVGT